MGVALLAGASVTPLRLAPAAVTDAQFPPNNVRDLIAICAPAPDDPRMTASVNFCHGFVEGAVIVQEANEAHKGARKLFCLPSPRPPAQTACIACRRLISPPRTWGKLLRPNWGKQGRR